MSIRERIETYVAVPCHKTEPEIRPCLERPELLLAAGVGFLKAFHGHDREPRPARASNYNRFLGSLKIGLNGLIRFGSWPLRGALKLNRQSSASLTSGGYPCAAS
jgi:hypothetical protein